jgi:inhibitor of the pro-sigma K processing machinery
LNIAEEFFLLIALLFLALIAFKLFSAPLKLALKVVVNTALGFLALIALDLCSPLLGLHIAVNLVNALIVGILGLPGLALLVLMQWVFLV